MSATCSRLSERLQAARGDTSELMSRTAELVAQKEGITERHDQVTSFLERFQLSEADSSALESPNVDKQFFHALERIGSIRKECKGLLQTGQERVALDILDSFSNKLEKGYEKLYKWVQKESREVESGELREKFISALRLLRPMPVYYQHCCQVPILASSVLFL